MNQQFKTTQNQLNDLDSKFEIVGSYRRNRPDSGDIDIIITSNKNNKAIYDKFLNNLNNAGIIKAFLSKGDIKSMVVAKLNDESIARRVDFLYSPPDEYAFAILYFTGSKEFNTAMRQHALSQNLTLNEHGFHIMENKVKGEKITDTKFLTEQDIFDYLNMEFKSPESRQDQNSVVLKSKSKQPETSKQKTIKNKTAKTAKTTKTETLKKTSKKTQQETIINNIENFKHEGISKLNILSQDELTDMLKYAIEDYYTSDKGENQILTDNEYDILREYMLEKYPDNKVAKDQHAEIELDKNKVKLPYEMWSMDKIKPDTNALKKFKSKFSEPFVISCKLDGISALYTCHDKKQNLYTRGNGRHGQKNRSFDTVSKFTKTR